MKLENIFLGMFLSKFCNIVPIQKLYELYLQIGDVHTIGDFMQQIFLKGKSLLCYQELKYANFKRNVTPNGNNVIIIGHSLEYLGKYLSIS